MNDNFCNLINQKWTFLLFVVQWVGVTFTKMESNSKENCPICFEKANPKKPFHCHFGVVCCLKCKSFFRRVIQSHGNAANLENVFYCVRSKLNKKCDMKQFGILHKCPKCRLIRCLELGMKPDKVVLDEETRRKFTGM